VFNRPIAAITIGLLSAAPTAQAGSQLFEGSWRVKALGNEITGGTGDSEFYSAVGLPQGIQCNAKHPRCAFESTPTDGSGNFSPGGLGHASITTPYCRLWTQFGGATARPAKGGTATTGNGRPYPPLYRNPAFFTPGGHPDSYICYPYSPTSPFRTRPVINGNPLTGTLWAVTTGTGRGGFSFPAAGASGSGIQGTRVGDRSAIYPYLYSYTYATLRNDAGVFGPGKGPGSFSIPYKVGPTTTVAKVVVKQGAAKFGGTMRMLGQLTSKAGHWLGAGGGTFSISSPNWRYEAIGAAAYTSDGAVTRGYLATWYSCGGAGYFTCWVFPGYGPVLSLIGSRFPWTTGSVTVTAVGRGPHKTVHYAKGYDNRTPTGGEGTIQLVSPTLTRWLGFVDFETGGIGILRIKFVPEPRVWVMLIAGGSLLGALYRWRR
jgi:hypothetical protein